MEVENLETIASRTGGRDVAKGKLENMKNLDDPISLLAADDNLSPLSIKEYQPRTSSNPTVVQ